MLLKSAGMVANGGIPINLSQRSVLSFSNHIFLHAFLVLFANYASIIATSIL